VCVCVYYHYCIEQDLSELDFKIWTEQHPRLE